MNEREEHRADQEGRASTARLKSLLCRRTGEQVRTLEHERCPYCFGRLAEIESGQHELFCDYREGVDPVHFGFPEGDERFERG